MALSKEFYLDEIRSKYPNSYNESLKDLPVKDLEDMLDFLEGALEKADGGSIGIEVFFGPKREDFSIGGKAKKSNKTPYDPRASIQDYAAALQKVGGGTDAQKLQDIGRYGLSQMQNSPNFFKAVGQGINQHMINNQMLRDAVDAGRITEEQYKLMGGYDVAKLTHKIGLGNIKIGGTPADVGIASALYNAIKAGGIGLEKLGIKEKDPFNQYGDIGFFESIAKNYQGAKGLSESDKALYESIISGKTTPKYPDYLTAARQAEFYKNNPSSLDSDLFRAAYARALPNSGIQTKILPGGQIYTDYGNYDPSRVYSAYMSDRGTSSSNPFFDQFKGSQYAEMPAIMKAMYGAPGNLNPYYADGGRVGLFMGGDPLTGQALSIYNSMNAYGFSDQEIADALSARGLYTPAGSGTGTETTAPNIIGSQINQGRDTGPTRPTSEIVTDFQESITNRQNKLNNPGKIASFVGDFIPQQRSIADMLASGQVDTRLTGGIPLGIGSMIAKALPDKYYDMSLADQITTQAYMGYTDPNTNIANRDPFGLNVRSAFGNYAEKAAEIVGTLEEKLARRGELSKYDQARLDHYRNVTKTKQAAVADIGLINLAKEQEEKRQAEAAKRREIENRIISGGANIGGGGGGNITTRAGTFAPGDYSDVAGTLADPREKMDYYKDGGLATMFKNKR